LSLPQYIELDGTVLELHGELVDPDIQRHRIIEDATGSEDCGRLARTDGTR